MADIEQGTVTVNDVTFDWWTTGTDNPIVTVSNPNYGRKLESVELSARRFLLGH